MVPPPKIVPTADRNSRRELGNFVAICLIGNVLAIMGTSFLMLWGGPLFWLGQLALTPLAVALYHGYLQGRRTWPFRYFVPIPLGLGVVLLVAGTILVIQDHRQGTHQQFVERKAMPLPEGCSIGEMMPGGVNRFFAKCSGSVEQVVSSYASRRKEGWTATSSGGRLILRRRDQTQGLIVIRDVRGTQIVIEAPDYSGPWYGAHGFWTH